MARRGVIGQVGRRAMPDITNMLVSIAREMVAQEDQNIMSAWQSGGRVNGHKITDEMVIEHWRERMSSVSKDDPMWDLYHNSVLQLDYSIHESKQRTLYAQKKITDGQMAAFYTNWAKKVPKHSEFYRTLQRDAAQFMQAAQTRSSYETQAAANAKYVHDSNQIAAQTRKPGDYLLGLITHMATTGNADLSDPGAIIEGGIDPNSGRETGTLGSMDYLDPQRLIDLIGLINTQDPDGGGPSPKTGGVKPTDTPGRAKGSDVILAYDDHNQPITGKDVYEKMHKLYPDFDGNINVSFVHTLVNEQVRGVDRQIALARRTGHASDIPGLKQQKSAYRAMGRVVDAIPVKAAYVDARTEKQDILRDPASTPAMKIAAQEAYESVLVDLAADPRIEGDMALINQLTAEAERKTGMPTLGESMGGAQFDATENTDVSSSPRYEMDATLALVNNWQAQEDAIAQFPEAYVYAQGNDNGNGTVTLAPGGQSTGVVLLSELQKLGDLKTIGMIPNPDGTGMSTVAMIGKPIYVTATGPNGETLAGLDNNPIGYSFTDMSSGTAVTQYQYVLPGMDRPVFSTEPPHGLPASALTEEPGRTVVDVSSLMPPLEALTPDGTPNQQVGDGWYITGSKINKTTGVVTPGGLQFDGYAVAMGTIPEHTTGSANPMTDTFSLTIGFASHGPQASDTLSKVVASSDAQRVIMTDAVTASGGAIDPVTGMPVGGDPGMYQALMEQGAIMQRSGGIGVDDLESKLQNQWEQGKTYTGYGNGKNLGVANGIPGGWDTNRLPLEQLGDNQTIGSDGKPVDLSVLGQLTKVGGEMQFTPGAGWTMTPEQTILVPNVPKVITPSPTNEAASQRNDSFLMNSLFGNPKITLPKPPPFNPGTPASTTGIKTGTGGGTYGTGPGGGNGTHGGNRGQLRY